MASTTLNLHNYSFKTLRSGSIKRSSTKVVTIKELPQVLIKFHLNGSLLSSHKAKAAIIMSAHEKVIIIMICCNYAQHEQHISERALLCSALARLPHVVMICHFNYV